MAAAAAAAAARAVVVYHSGKGSETGGSTSRDITKLCSLGLESFSRKQSQSGGRQTDSTVLLAAARQTPECFRRPHRDSRVFLAADMETLESSWVRVILACYIGFGVPSNSSRDDGGDGNKGRGER
ncbi:hypothetical protein PoB_005504500 [Plakobranchus ocellatus]|uniref:Uncharacterized protein n=1 Tax=Plakobranchus ocellatus TaxID=259542 RepID=A0AAV4C755_9GAST|nr:hypothetical protein PoB_005504500 [Plakobranchus ocellatus]